MKNVKVLALDIATNTGWAVGTRLGEYGVWNFAIKRDEDSGMRLLRFRSKLNELLKEIGFNMVVFERSAGMHASSVIVQSELHGVLKLFCKDNNINYRAYSATEIKKHATGKGNSGKPLMIKAAKEKFGYAGDDDNVADAIHIWDLAVKDLNC